MEPLNPRDWPRALCPVEDCGAAVILARIDGEEIALNPISTSVAVPDEDGRWRVEAGLQPHAYTCVDIGARHRFRVRWEGPEAAHAPH